VYRPDMLITCARQDHPSDFIRELAQKTQQTTAYLCEGQSCQLPIHDPRELEERLRGK